MRKILLTTFVTFGLNAFVSAQEQLEVEYEARIEMDYDKLFEQTASQMGDQAAYMTKDLKDMLVDVLSKPIPNLLRLNQDESMYTKIQTIDNSQSPFGGVSMDHPGVAYYKNFKENYLYQIIEIPGETRLIKDSLNTIDWTITKESQEILGYEVRKATALTQSEAGTRKAEIHITAWYAPKLPFKNGPESYGGLPGLILKLELNVEEEGSDMAIKQIYEATSIKPSKSKKKIEAPSKGKIMTKEELAEDLKKAQKEINSKMSGNGSFMIITQ